MFDRFLLFSGNRAVSLDCRIGIGFGFGFGFTTSFGWLVYLLWFWFYDSQVKTALYQKIILACIFFSHFYELFPYTNAYVCIRASAIIISKERF